MIRSAVAFTVDGDVKDERIVNQVNAYTFCLVKSA